MRAHSCHRVYGIHATAWICWLLFSPSSLPGQARSDSVHLTLEQARALALRANPELSAARLDADVARGELRQSSLLLRSNPTVEFLAEGSSRNGPEGLLTQEIELFGQTGARRAVGRAGLDRAASRVGNATRLTLADADRFFYRLISAERRAALAASILELNRRLADVVERQLRAGKVSRLDFNLALVERGRSEARTLSARRERQVIETELVRFLGLPQGTAVEPVSADSLESGAAGVSPMPLPPTPRDTIRLDIDSLTDLALARRPDLAERRAAIRHAESQATLAGREALPNLTLRLATEQNAAGDRQVLRPGIGLTLPLFNRNRGTVQAQRARARQAELERGALEARIRAEVSRGVRSYESASMAAAVLETSVLVPARENRRLLETAYREGKVGLPVLLLIRNQVIDAESEYWSTWLAAREAFTDLTEVTGQTLPIQGSENGDEN